MQSLDKAMKRFKYIIKYCKLVNIQEFFSGVVGYKIIFWEGDYNKNIKTLFIFIFVAFLSFGQTFRGGGG